MKITRGYNSKDVDMIIAADTIIDTAIANKTFLQGKRTTWADPYFANIKAQIQTTTQTYLGVDSAKELRQATQAVIAILQPALKDLAEVKIQIEEDFKSTPVRQTEILTQLGFNTYHKAAQKGDQEALINLLYQFKTNLLPALKTEITAKGTAATTLTTIIGYADALKAADVTQEGKKGARAVITDAAIIQFNDIYSKIISITKISAKFYKDNSALKDQFSFNKVAKKINQNLKTKTTKTETPS